jgi:hypothetical protein
MDIFGQEIKLLVCTYDTKYINSNVNEGNTACTQDLSCNTLTKGVNAINSSSSHVYVIFNSNANGSNIDLESYPQVMVIELKPGGADNTRPIVVFSGGSAQPFFTVCFCDYFFYLLIVERCLVQFSHLIL